MLMTAYLMIGRHRSWPDVKSTSRIYTANKPDCKRALGSTPAYPLTR